MAREIFEETGGNAAQPVPSNYPDLGAGTFYAMAHTDSPVSDKVVATLNAEHVSERLARLEQSLIQLERINSATLHLMQKMLQAHNPSETSTENVPI